MAAEQPLGGGGFSGPPTSWPSGPEQVPELPCLSDGATAAPASHRLPQAPTGGGEGGGTGPNASAVRGLWGAVTVPQRPAVVTAANHDRAGTARGVVCCKRRNFTARVAGCVSRTQGSGPARARRPPREGGAGTWQGCGHTLGAGPSPSRGSWLSPPWPRWLA